MDADVLFCLATIVALSLVLPLSAHAGLRRASFDARAALRWVWACQIAGSLAGLTVIAAPVSPIVGPVISAAACMACLAGLRRLRIATAAS